MAPNHDSEKPPTSNPLASIPPALKGRKAKVIGIFTLILTTLGVFAEYWPALSDVLSIVCHSAGACHTNGR